MAAVITACGMMLAGCNKPDAEISASAVPLDPAAAASQLQKVFSAAPPEIRDHAVSASEAIRQSNYEQAIRSLYSMGVKTNLTLEQSIAVYNSQKSLEATLIAGMEAGDANAKRAYELLKKSRRN